MRADAKAGVAVEHLWPFAAIEVSTRRLGILPDLAKRALKRNKTPAQSLRITNPV